jgi:hypothetical protein
MDNSFTSENFTLLLAYPFKDPNWKKKLSLGMVVALVPILAICLQGYISRIIQRVASEDGDPYLPEWDDWGRLFIDGLRIFVVSLIGMLPSLVCILPSIMVIYASIFIPAFLSDSSNGDISPALVIFPLLGSLGGLLLLVVGIAISLGLSLVLPAALTHVVVKQSITALFKIEDWWAVWRANMGGFIMCTLVVLGFSFAINIVFQFLSVLMILCCPLYFLAIGAFTEYLCLILFPLYAQVYREGVNKLAIQNASKG